MGRAGRIRVGVAGLDHDHGLVLAARLRQAGAAIVAYDARTRRDAFVMRLLGPAARPRSIDDIVDASDIDVVVTATIPSARAGVALRALRAGKHVVADKPGVTTADDLAAIDAAVAETGRRWWVVFGERAENRAVAEACERARLGDVGRVVSVLGLGPHRMGAGGRPDWFWSPAQTGGILVDIGSHQADQFLAATAATDVEVVAASVGNVASPHHPDMEDIGMVVWRGAGAIGTHRVDYLSPAGLRTWGDGRLMIVGTDGTLEVRTNVDVAGRRGNQHLLVVDQRGVRRIGCRRRRVDWARRVLDDVRSGGDSFLSHRHIHAVCDLTLRARAVATTWPPAPEAASEAHR